MTRFRIPDMLKRRLRFYQDIDAYSHRWLPSHQRSIEHIIPVRLTPQKTIQHDPIHLYVTSAALNGFRSDYRFGGEVEELRCGGPRWIQMEGSYKDPHRRVFYPKNGHRLIAHVVWKMMDKHPELRDHEDQLFESTRCWDRWLQKPWTPLERHILDNNEMLYTKNEHAG